MLKPVNKQNVLCVNVPGEMLLQVPEQLIVFGKEERNGEGKELPSLNEDKTSDTGLALR